MLAGAAIKKAGDVADPRKVGAQGAAMNVR
jgi:hypothetical protein